MKTNILVYYALFLISFSCLLSIKGYTQDSLILDRVLTITNTVAIEKKDNTTSSEIYLLNNEASFKLRNHESPFIKKVMRGEKYIGGLELISMGILIMAPKKWTKWDEDWMQAANRNIKRAWTRPPIIDKDDWDVNYIGHAVAGSYYYNTVRSQNASPFQSFAFTAFQSTLWEYVIEGIAERPSIQDLIYTPISGIVFGEITHILTLQMRRNGFNLAEKAFVLVFNPMYAINNGFRNKRNQYNNKLAIH